jgi:thiosulfate dehydrogenase [quinone] large subunit
MFIGIGWLRAGFEKFTDAGWLQGTALVEFFNQHITSGQVRFPVYQGMVQNVFTPGALALSWLIMVGQILVGAAVITGTLTNLALLCGLIMNMNFILIGEVTPSAFYVVIQMVLLVTNAGYVLGVDALLVRKIRIGLLVAQPYSMRKYWRFERGAFLVLSIAMAILALAVIPYIRDFSPHSVEDPAMVLFVVSVIVGLSAWITAFKFPQNRKLVYRPVITRGIVTRSR